MESSKPAREHDHEDDHEDDDDEDKDKHEDAMFFLQLKGNTAGSMNISSMIPEPVTHVSTKKHHKKRSGFGKTKTVKVTK